MKRTLLSLLCLVVYYSLAIPEATNWQLYWSEEFNAPSINSSRWTFVKTCSPNNNELQCYTDRKDNAYIDNGNLVLLAKLEKGYNSKKQYTSARLNTQCERGGFGTFYKGKFEMRAKLPLGKHLWPAFWLIPADNTYGGWPRSGEIDIMEYRGQEPNRKSSALHFGSPQASEATGPVTFDKNFGTDYHTFGLIWDSQQFVFLVDDTPHWTVPYSNRMWTPGPYTKKGQPWDQRFHIIINVAVGGNFFNGYPPLTEADAKAWQRPSMIIDYIRVYHAAGEDYTPSKKGLPSVCGTEAGAAGIHSNRSYTYLGVGIGVGVLLVVTVFSVLIWRYKRQKRPNKISTPTPPFPQEDTYIEDLQQRRP